MNYCFHPAHTCAATQEGRDSARLGIDTFPAAVRVFAGIALLTGILAAQESVNAAGVRSQFNIQAQTACETEMLREMGAREVFSGKGYEVLLLTDPVDEVWVDAVPAFEEKPLASIARGTLDPIDNGLRFMSDSAAPSETLLAAEPLRPGHVWVAAGEGHLVLRDDVRLA